MPAIAWGSDDGQPAPTVTLAADLPADPPDDDPDPASHPVLDAALARLGEDIVNVVGVRAVVGGRLHWCDAGDADFEIGTQVVVDGERGPRVGTIATRAARRATRDRGLRRVLRVATPNDLRGEHDGDADRARVLRIAKDLVASLRLPMKVYRVEGSTSRGGKLNVYYTTDDRLDLRDLVRELTREVGAIAGGGNGVRFELRQLGVRDEAKAVGGIGSCGLTLCCTTWLPDFVPVSIKMAKDQGLVLSPSKVSGQCGRLKCCLVYEQAGYAELRKGLPKLGKRVVSTRGEGRVVEVDVLRQRVRVSYGMGDSEVLPATEVKPLFPAGGQPPGGGTRGGSPSATADRGGRGERGESRRDRDASAKDTADDHDPVAAEIAAMDARLAHDVEPDDSDITDDPSSQDFRGTDDPSSDDYDA